MSYAPLRLAFAGMGAGIAFELVRALTGVGGPSLNALTNDWVYMAVELIAVAACAARVLTRRPLRTAWALMTLALACWSAGDLLWAVWLDQLARPPFPSAADVAYLCMYPPMYGALMMMIRARLRTAAVAQWLDGGVLALAVSALAAALVFSDVAGETSGGRLIPSAVTIAYPTGDVILLMFVALGVALTRGRTGRVWGVLGAGVAVMVVADIIDVDEVAGGVYVSGGLLNVVYLCAFSLLALAAWAPARGTRQTHAAPHTIAVTAAAAALALGLLVTAAFTAVSPLAVALAAGAIVLASVRSGLTYRENVAILRARSREATRDLLTGLANRRQLMTDLEEALDEEDPAGATLAFFDLNGFKAYNDTFGHLAGDVLLTRLGAALAAAAGSRGRAYRLGGDEFCVLADGRHGRDDALVAHLTAALRERGQGFDVSTSAGLAVLPDEATSADSALRIADERMYADKGRSQRSQTRDVLMALLSERAPGLHDHSSDVTRLVAAVAGELGLDSEQLDEVLRAAELHDIGKLAIPDAILDKPGPLDDAEWAFMRRHPIIGERILGAAPALAPVAALVRSSHERYDGGGYPDGLAGEAIPLGARIVFACDAFDAIVSERCYQAARSPREALAELRRCAGTQFDPTVVTAIERALAARSHESPIRALR